MKGPPAKNQLRQRVGFVVLYLGMGSTAKRTLGPPL
jgi:hypothetical protein